jgi:hypothetical protein
MEAQELNRIAEQFGVTFSLNYYNQILGLLTEGPCVSKLLGMLPFQLGLSELICIGSSHGNMALFFIYTVAYL